MRSRAEQKDVAPVIFKIFLRAASEKILIRLFWVGFLHFQLKFLFVYGLYYYLFSLLNEYIFGGMPPVEPDRR